MKTVLLLDHGIAGHKYAFAKLFTKYLLRLDFKVVLVLPEKTAQIKEELIDSEGELVDALFPVDLKIEKRINIKLHKRIDPVLRCFLLWYYTRRIVTKAEKMTQQEVDVVFLCWLDDYVTNYLSHSLIDLIFPYQWAGLYFHPWYLFDVDYDKVSISSQDNVLRAKKCIGCGVHDEILQAKLKNRIRKPVLYFPEIADGSAPMEDYSVARILKEKANGRPIVGLIGLAKRKGVLHLLDVIEKDFEKQHFYFLAGKVPYENYSLKEQKRIKQFVAQQVENVFYYNDYISEGPTINALISAFDILYLVYNNFKSSSNFLTKAAIFKKMSVGIDSYWIGENIQKYSLGLTVSGDRPSDTLGAFCKISDKNHDLCPRWDDFLSLNGEEQLLPAFKKLLGYQEHLKNKSERV